MSFSALIHTLAQIFLTIKRPNSLHPYPSLLSCRPSSVPLSFFSGVMPSSVQLASGLRLPLLVSLLVAAAVESVMSDSDVRVEFVVQVLLQAA